MNLILRKRFSNVGMRTSCSPWVSFFHCLIYSIAFQNIPEAVLGIIEHHMAHLMYFQSLGTDLFVEYAIEDQIRPAEMLCKHNKMMFLHHLDN